MPLTRERKVYLAILGLAGVVLSADKLLGGLTGPKSASAATRADSAAVSPGVSPSGTLPTPPQSTAKSPAGSGSDAIQPGQLAERIKAVAEASDVEPGLAASLFDRRLSVPPVANSASLPRTAEQVSTPASVPIMSVSAVVASGRTKAAVVNGRIVPVGSQFQGVTLTAVDSAGATFRAGGREWVVHLKR